MVLTEARAIDELGAPDEGARALAVRLADGRVVCAASGCPLTPLEGTDTWYHLPETAHLDGHGCRFTCLALRHALARPDLD